MSTWICDSRRAALLAAVLALAGCLDGFGTDSAPEVARAGPVAIAGPPGYCVDPVGTRESPDGTFVLLGSCAALNGSDRGAHPDRVAVLTASVSAAPGEVRIADTLDELAAFFASEPGRAMLSRSGSADSVTLIDWEARGGVLYLRLSEPSPFDGPDVGLEYWRAVFDVGDRMVMLSVIPQDLAPLGPQGARRVLDAFVARVQDENDLAAQSGLFDAIEEARLAPARPVAAGRAPRPTGV